MVVDIKDLPTAAKLKELGAMWDHQAANAGVLSDLSKAEDAEIELGDFGWELMPFQRAGVAYGDLADDRYMIADEQGLGKTIQALARLQVKQSFPAVIVCPSSVKVKWARAIQRAFPKRTVEVLEGQTPHKLTADVSVLNWDILSYWPDQIISAKPQAVVYDESHYAKERKSQRTIAAQAVAKSIPAGGMILPLTGTPILNRPIELVEQLNLMGRLDDFGGFGRFVTKYVGWDEVPAGPRAGKKIPAKNGAMNLPELNEKLRSTCYVRRLKKDVLPELPEKQRDVVPIPLDSGAYHKALAEARERVLSGESSGYAEHLAEIEHLKQAAAAGKLQGVIDWITDFLETGEKLVVFADHRDVQDKLHKAFPGSLRIAGRADQSKKARQEAMDSFQDDPTVKLVICSLKSASEGIDLYASSNLAFVELGWNPGIHDQAEDRIHRIGQKDGAMMYYLLADGTIDEQISRLIEKKRVIKDAATEGKDVVNEPDHNMVGDLIKWLTEGFER